MSNAKEEAPSLRRTIRKLFDELKDVANEREFAEFSSRVEDRLDVIESAGVNLDATHPVIVSLDGQIQSVQDSVDVLSADLEAITGVGVTKTIKEIEDLIVSLQASLGALSSRVTSLENAPSSQLQTGSFAFKSDGFTVVDPGSATAIVGTNVIVSRSFTGTAETVHLVNLSETSVPGFTSAPRLLTAHWGGAGTPKDYWLLGGSNDDFAVTLHASVLNGRRGLVDVYKSSGRLYLQIDRYSAWGTGSPDTSLTMQGGEVDLYGYFLPAGGATQRVSTRIPFNVTHRFVVSAGKYYRVRVYINNPIDQNEVQLLNLSLTY